MTSFRMVFSGTIPMHTCIPQPTSEFGEAIPRSDPMALPSILVANGKPLQEFLRMRSSMTYREWVLDSGAFSAFTIGEKVDLEEFIDTCHMLTETDPTLKEIFALDVIGDWRASAKNYRRMWDAGVKAIPAYHANEPIEVLDDLAATYPKIAFGGVAVGASGFPHKARWARECMERIWPKRVHGLGFGTERLLMSAPFHTVDSANWVIGPRRYGSWAFLNDRLKGSVSPRPSPDLRYLMRVEQRARLRWAKELAELEVCP